MCRLQGYTATTTYLEVSPRVYPNTVTDVSHLRMFTAAPARQSHPKDMLLLQR